MKNFITQSESLTKEIDGDQKQITDEKYLSVTQLPQIKMESNRVNKRVLMNESPRLVLISTEAPN